MFSIELPFPKSCLQMAPMLIPDDVHLELGGPNYKLLLFNLEKMKSRTPCTSLGEGLVIVREDYCFALLTLLYDFQRSV